MDANIEQITAEEFLEAKIKSNRGRDDWVSFKRLKEELESHPKVKERLALEFLEMTSKELEGGSDPSIGGYAFLFHDSITHSKKAEYFVTLEGIITRLFRAIEQKAFLGNECCPIGFALRMALTILRGMDGRRFRATAKMLRKILGTNSESSLRYRILIETEQSKAQMERAIRDLGRQVRKHRIEAEAKLASYKN